MPFFKGIHFQTSGVPGKPPIVFLHGFMGSADDWNKTLPLLTADFFCLALDLPGHGQSNDIEALDDVWSFENLCRRIDELMTHLGIQKFSLAGYSMGGRVALNFALTFQDRLLSLIIESSSPGIKKKAERQQRIIDDQRLTERLMNLPISKFLDMWYSLPVFIGVKKHPDYEEMIKRRLNNDPGLLARALITFSTGKHSFLEKNLSSLKFPVCLICGEKDPKYVDLFTHIKKNNPPFTLKIIKNCSHNTHFECPDQFAGDLKQFLSL